MQSLQNHLPQQPKVHVSPCSPPRCTVALTTFESAASTSTQTITSSQTSAGLPSSTSTSAPKKESQAWIAGAVVGPIAGLALIGAIILFLVRRKKKSTTPVGVEQYADAKPFTHGQGSYYGQDSYSQYGHTPVPQYDVYAHAQQTEPAAAELGDGAILGQSKIAELGDAEATELSGERTQK